MRSSETRAAPVRRRTVSARLLPVWRDLRFAARFGLALLGAGAVIDISAHWDSTQVSSALTAWQTAGHMVVLAGMVLTLFGVLAGARRSESNRPPPAHPNPTVDHRTRRNPTRHQGGENANR